MIKILSLLAFCLITVGGSPPKNRIINGSFTNIEQYPFLAALLLATDNINFKHQCGGAIINNRSVLTAAHCIIAPVYQTQVRVGSTLANSGGSVHRASLIIIHPEYVSYVYHLDVAIVRVTTAFSFGGNVQVARIAGPNYNVGDNQSVWAVGWGYTSTDLSTPSPSENLRHVQIKTVTQSVCQSIFGTFFKPFIMCAGGGGFGVCFGDSGGPLVHNNVVVGVVAISSTPCGDDPAAFVRVSSVTNWIQTNA